MAFMSGQMVANTTDTGAKTSYTIKESTHGPMADNTTVPTKTTKNMGTEFILGPTAKNSQATGKTGSSMDKASSRTRRERAESASGRMETEFAGCQAMSKKWCELQCTAKSLMIEFSLIILIMADIEKS